MGNAVDYKPTRGAIAAAARKLNRHKQSVHRSFKAGDPEVLAAVAKEDLAIQKRISKLRQEYANARARASRLAETESNNLQQ